MKKLIFTLCMFIFLCGCAKEEPVGISEVKEEEEIPKYHTDGRKILTFATCNLHKEDKTAINNFNGQNEEYYIEIIDYCENGDIAAGYEQYNLDLTNGTAGDILSVDCNGYEQYSQLGVYEDLYPYMENDGDIHMEDYWESILSACESDGKLYYLPTIFTVNAVFGYAKDWENDGTLTLDETMALMQSRGEDTKLFDGLTKDSFIEYILNNAEDEYINWDVGECYFDSEEFVKVLEMANTLPDERVQDEENVVSKIRRGNVLLYEQKFGHIMDAQVINAIFEDEVVMLNYPGATKSGNTMNMYLSYAINSNSENKEGAWQFIKYLMSEECQKAQHRNATMMIPLRKDVFEAHIEEEATARISVDLEGNKVKEPFLYGIDNGVSFELYTATGEEEALLRQVIEGVTCVNKNNHKISGIVLEEAAAYFAGQKTAKGVATIIQSRIEIYINEIK